LQYLRKHAILVCEKEILIMPVPKNSSTNARVNVRKVILNQLYGWIIDGTLEPGEKISDIEIAKYFQTSRTPVREAIQVLSEEKLVNVLPGQGTYVAPIDKKNTREVYEMLSMLHGLAVEITAPYLTKLDIANLEELLVNFEHAISGNSMVDVQRTDAEFHGYFITLSKNRYLSSFVNQLAVQVYRIENLLFSNYTGRTRSLAMHKNILDALQKNDVVNAVKYTRENWMSFHDEIK